MQEKGILSPGTPDLYVEDTLVELVPRYIVGNHRGSVLKEERDPPVRYDASCASLLYYPSWCGDVCCPEADTTIGIPFRATRLEGTVGGILVGSCPWVRSGPTHCRRSGSEV
jgi:hypothetical protein